MIDSEKAYDMLPAVVELYDKLDLDGYRKKIAAENEGKLVSKTDAGIDGFKYILINSGKVKQEIFELVAIFDDKTVEEVKRQNFLITIKSFKAIVSDEEVMGFFKDAVL